MKPPLLALTVLAASSLASAAKDLDPTKYSSGLRSFIGDVVYEVEAGDRDKHFKRLPANLKLNYHCTPAQQQLCDTKLKPFLDATSVSIESPADTSSPVATLDIYFGDSKSMEAKAAEISKEISTTRGSTYWKWWDTNNVTTRAVIIICTDRLGGPELEDKLIEQLLAVFGLPSKSDAADNSCMAEDEKTLTSLQPLDQVVLKFLYINVPAGTRPADLNKLVREKWEPKH